jgi:hypothetical protein
MAVALERAAADEIVAATQCSASSFLSSERHVRIGQIACRIANRNGGPRACIELPIQHFELNNLL